MKLRHLLVFVSIASVGCSSKPSHPEGSSTPDIQVVENRVQIRQGAPQWGYVELAVAQEQAPLPPSPAPGRVGFDEARTAAVGAPLAGRVEEVHVQLGDVVKAGDRLFSVRSGALADLARDVDVAKEEVSVKQRAADRTKELVKLQAAPEKEAAAAQAELREAELNQKAALARRSSLQIATLSENLYWVIAPRSGTVVELNITPHQEVSADAANPLLKICNLDEVLVVADAQESDLVDVTPDTPAVVKLPSGTARTGRVKKISQVIDPSRRTVSVRVQVPNQDHLLRPNGFVEVTFTPSDTQTPRVRVPAEAVVTDGNHQVVFVAQDDGSLRRVPVTLLRQREGFAEIMTGLSVGQRYVSKGALLLQNQIELSTN